jgi:hypothetical protein
MEKILELQQGLRKGLELELEWEQYWGLDLEQY